jgi:hypothetical protein
LKRSKKKRETRTKCRRIEKKAKSGAIKKSFQLLLAENCDFYGVLHAAHDAPLFTIAKFIALSHDD